MSQVILLSTASSNEPERGYFQQGIELCWRLNAVWRAWPRPERAEIDVIIRAQWRASRREENLPGVPSSPME
jgi:hypothetical protein